MRTICLGKSRGFFLFCVSSDSEAPLFKGEKQNLRALGEVSVGSAVQALSFSPPGLKAWTAEIAEKGSLRTQRFFCLFMDAGARKSASGAGKQKALR